MTAFIESLLLRWFWFYSFKYVSASSGSRVLCTADGQCCPCHAPEPDVVLPGQKVLGWGSQIGLLRTVMHSEHWKPPSSAALLSSLKLRTAYRCRIFCVLINSLLSHPLEISCKQIFFFITAYFLFNCLFG